jgi:thymidine phosphorylase
MVHKKVGDRVTVGEPLCTIHYNSPDRLAAALPLIEQGYTISTAALLHSRPLIHRIIGDSK